MRSLILGLLCVAWSSSAAWAQAALADPDAPEDYSASIVERPLALPASLFEMRSKLRSVTYGDDFDVGVGDLVYLDLGLGVGLGDTEIFAETNLTIEQPDTFESDRLEGVTFGTLSRVSPDSVLYLHGRYWQPMSDEVRGLEVRGAYWVRRKGADNLSFLFGGGARYVKTMYQENAAPFNAGPYVLSVEARALLQSQLSRRFAVEAGVDLSIPIADGYGDSFDPGTSTTLRGAATMTGHTLDLVGAIELIGGNGVSTRQFTIGAATRI